MDHGTVLDIAAGTDADSINVAAYYGHGPDRTVIADDDIADDDRGLVDVDTFTQLRVYTFIYTY
jgi:hypothetical protein